MIGIIKQHKIAYEKEKARQRHIWLERVLSNSMGADMKKLLKEAKEKFEKEYPSYKKSGII